VVHAAFSSVASSLPPSSARPVVVAAFVDRPSWKSLDFPHPLKTDSELHLAKLPTLFRFVHGVCVATLVEAECSNASAVHAFITKHE